MWALAARWVGYDGQSKGHHVYWDTTHHVTVDQKIRFGELSLPVVIVDGVELEGEQVSGDDNKPTSTANATEECPIDKPSMPPASPKPEVLELPPALQPMRIRKLLQKVSDILAGKGTDSSIPCGVQAPVEPAAKLLEEVSGTAMAAQIAEVKGLDPQSLAEAKHRPEWLRWQEAIQKELRTPEVHSTWCLKRPSPDANIVSCQWVFHPKKDMAGNMNRYCACLVAHGFSQIPGVDFFNTYAPVAKMASIRTLLAFAACHDLDVHQVDIKSAYLNGEFEEDKVTYMAMPLGVTLTHDKSLALCLLGPLYGLCQSTRNWHKKLCSILQNCLHMSVVDIDQAVFYRSEHGKLIAMGVHIDDLTIVVSASLMDEVKTNLQKDFKITDEGEIH